jgi:serine/threonine protein kinase/tetratricopeptide (TPR) repeat protein
VTVPAIFGGRYSVVRELGRGGQKVVYLVHDRVLDRECALALIEEAMDAEGVARLRQEAQSLARMGTQPNIVTVHDMGEEGGRPYVVSEFVSGGDLASEIKKAGGALPIQRALEIVQHILRALSFIHERGIIHRDLKPSNVWISADGTAKLGDFGLALAPDRARLTMSNTVTGTPSYVSPEQLENRPLDGRADLYSLGCLLFELLTGRTPFLGTVVSVISQHLHAAPTPPSKLNAEIPPELDAFVLKLLSKAPDQRPASARQALQYVDETFGLERSGPLPERPVTAPLPVSEQSVPLPPAKKSPAVVLAGAIALLAVVGIAAVALRSSPPPPVEKPRRVVIVPTRDLGMTVNSTIAWALASRLVEVVDRYREFRPVSHAGMLAARLHCLGDSSVVPDETDAQRIGTNLSADTVAALSIAQSGNDSELTVAIHVFSTEDPASGVSAPREKLRVHDLDADAPMRLGQQLSHALAKQWGKGKLTDESSGMQEPQVPFEAFQAYLDASEFCTIGRYDECERLVRKALEHDPDNPLFHSLITCALSYQGRDAETEQHQKIALELGPKLPSRLQRAHAKSSILWVEAERARAAGNLPKMREIANEMVALYTEFENAWNDPWGNLYSGAARQYFLDDIEGAKRMYALARQKGPMLYPPYYEEAKLIIGDGSSPEATRAAATLIWTFIECNPSSPLLPVARNHAQEWRLFKPEELPACPRMATR